MLPPNSALSFAIVSANSRFISTYLDRFVYVGDKASELCVCINIIVQFLKEHLVFSSERFA